LLLEQAERLQQTIKAVEELMNAHRDGIQLTAEEQVEIFGTNAGGPTVLANFPLSWKRTPLKVEAYRVNGTPADCVALGVSQWEGVDVVLSGINLGSNLGNSIWHSQGRKAAHIFRRRQADPCRAE